MPFIFRRICVCMSKRKRRVTLRREVHHERTALDRHPVDHFVGREISTVHAGLAGKDGGASER